MRHNTCMNKVLIITMLCVMLHIRCIAKIGYSDLRSSARPKLEKLPDSNHTIELALPPAI